MISLRAAKHRFESVATPLSTWCMWYPALLNTASEIIVMRSGVEVVSAAHLLQEISTKHCVSLAMMADAADDALAFTRSNDNCETMDIVRFNTDVFLFLVRVTELYASGKVVHMFSYTKFMLESLRLGPIMLPMQGAAAARFDEQKTVGNRNGPPRSWCRTVCDSSHHG